MVVLGCMGEDPPQVWEVSLPSYWWKKRNRKCMDVWVGFIGCDDGIHVGLFWDLRGRYAVAVKKKRE